jgi:hypothetical protein
VYCNGSGDIPDSGMPELELLHFYEHYESCSNVGLKCQHCGKRGANLGCYHGPCKQTYHFPCARLRAFQGQLVFSTSHRAMACLKHVSKLPEPHEVAWLGPWLEGAGGWDKSMTTKARRDWLPRLEQRRQLYRQRVEQELRDMREASGRKPGSGAKPGRHGGAAAAAAGSSAAAVLEASLEAGVAAAEPAAATAAASGQQGAISSSTDLAGGRSSRPASAAAEHSQLGSSVAAPAAAAGAVEGSTPGQVQQAQQAQVAEPKVEEGGGSGELAEPAQLVHLPEEALTQARAGQLAAGAGAAGDGAAVAGVPSPPQEQQQQQQQQQQQRSRRKRVLQGAGPLAEEEGPGGEGAGG